MPPRSSKSTDVVLLPSPGQFTRPPPSQYYTYRIQRGEQGVLTYEPYKSYLLPLWRFRTPSIAEKSSKALYEEFLRFYEEDDFVGMDMSRKFIQMGMTRSKRYANHKGGRKYDIGKDGQKEEIEKSQGHEGQEDKLIASGIFKEMWERCRGHEGYKALKEMFQKELKDWISVHGEKKRNEQEGLKVKEQEQSEERKYIKQEGEDVEDSTNLRQRKRPWSEIKEEQKIKKENSVEETSSNPRMKRKRIDL
ncbi:putative cytoplasmic protein [Botrytis fragariae]|uniref:Putative cytoplasmic protein n=1 Tax=Botrytis fragariae TaxID=1964551 RepID=A0A8H6ASN2_9HELO|nr:putative cytoplasmic protein [Botrytis fragariae]KAF5872833.1 putative cytoplasmic protein [Botrytis fragariae]